MFFFIATLFCLASASSFVNVQSIGEFPTSDPSFDLPQILEGLETFFSNDTNSTIGEFPTLSTDFEQFLASISENMDSYLQMFGIDKSQLSSIGSFEDLLSSVNITEVLTSFNEYLHKALESTTNPLLLWILKAVEEFTGAIVSGLNTTSSEGDITIPTDLCAIIPFMCPDEYDKHTEEGQDGTSFFETILSGIQQLFSSISEQFASLTEEQIQEFLQSVKEILGLPDFNMSGEYPTDTEPSFDFTGETQPLEYSSQLDPKSMRVRVRITKESDD